MLGEMLKLTEAADTRLDAQAEAFGRLRDLENTAPAVLEALAPRIAALRERIPQEERRLADLRGRFAESALAPVRDNVTEAQARLAAAEQEVHEALDALGAGRPGDAVGDIRAAEDAVAQTTTLLDAVGRLAADLEAAGGRVAAVRAETEKDLAEARSLVAAGNRSGLGPQIARAEAALTSADAALRPADGSPADPLTALRQLEEADIALEQALSVARDAQTQIRRAAAALDQAVLTARSTIAAAADFIATRRGAVGPEARTRLAEAQRHLDVAVDQGRDDPVGSAARGAPGRDPGAAGAGPGAGRRLAVVRRRLRRGLRRARRLRGRVRRGPAAVSTSAAWCSAGSWPVGAAAASVVGSAAARAASAAGVGAGPAAAASGGPAGAPAAAGSESPPGVQPDRTEAPGNCQPPVGRFLSPTNEETTCPPGTRPGPTAHPAGSTTAPPTWTPRRRSTRPCSAGSTPVASRSSAATSP